MRNRGDCEQRGDGGDQADVLWPGDEAENCREKSLLIFRMGLESFVSPARIHTSILKFDQKKR
jgi:hypothetical protein